MTGNPGGPRVLVVDDTDEVRTLIRRALAGDGYQVDVAASLSEATALGPAGYDAVLVDAHLGAERGTDLIDALLAEDPAAAGRCLVVTGGGLSLVPRGVASLAKPFRPGELLSAVRALHQRDPADGPDTAPRPAPAPAAGRQAAGMPGAWRLLGLIRRLREGERATLADFVHDGPIQELTAATLAVHTAGRLAAGGQAPDLGGLAEQVAAAAGSLRFLTDGDWAFPPPEASLPDAIRRRTAWLPLDSVTVDIRHTCAALRAEAPLIADVAELALFVMSDGALSGPPCQAHVCVQAGDDEAEIVLTLTQGTDVGGPAGAGGAPDRDAGRWAAGQDSLAELAAVLGGTAHTEWDPDRFQARITLPRQCAVGNRR